MNTLSTDQLIERLSHPNAPTVIDVLPDTHFERIHIAQAHNACIYEIDFLEKATALQSDKSHAIVVYGLNDAFEAAPLAAKTLTDAGWTQVSILSGGLEAWLDVNAPTIGDATPLSPPTGNFNFDAEHSQLRWVGRNLFNQHNGTVAISTSQISLEKGTLHSGEIRLDMNEILCEDIPDAGLQKVLIDHLRTNDFFLIADHPFASFTLEASLPIPKATPGSPNVTLSGSLELRGNVHPVTLPALLDWNDEAISLQGQFDLNRVLWGSKYGSGRVYEALGQHIVNDLISISFQLRFSR